MKRKFNVEKIANYLFGTHKSVDEAIYDLYESYDSLSFEQEKELFQIIAKCAICGCWEYIDDMYHCEELCADICNDCDYDKSF